ncbi:MAG: hypothetical protein HKN34_05190 [Gammaproteobacteria bacterium]|nr:hypothetical protein [Gammaproteobacteria bacterium]
MGDEVKRDHYSSEDYQLFQQKLDKEKAFVRSLFAKNSFDNRTRKLGYELELCLLNSDGTPAPFNKQILEKADNPLFTYELARYNHEINGNAFDLNPRVFAQVSEDLSLLYEEVKQAASAFDVKTAMFGVFPSLTTEHMDADRYMSDMFRYRLLEQRLMEMRERPVHLDIHGEDHLTLDMNGVMLEALSTSLQTHWQIPFDEAVDSYHASLWASMVMLAVSANSPLVFGKQCWMESRIAIFKQSVDTRNPREIKDSVIPRVHFAKGYISSWLELFDDNDYYSPILPDNRDTAVEELHHFNFHNGTIWRWVRPILGCDDGGYHLRLELRVTPSGPTEIDTLANIVFFIGLIEGLKQEPSMLTRVPFDVLNRDFYAVARDGLKAKVNWYDGSRGSIDKIILESAIPLANQGLRLLGVESASYWLDIIHNRVISGQTGAQWILQSWKTNRDLTALVRQYVHNAHQNKPVHSWNVE